MFRDGGVPRQSVGKRSSQVRGPTKTKGEVVAACSFEKVEKESVVKSSPLVLDEVKSSPRLLLLSDDRGRGEVVAACSRATR